MSGPDRRLTTREEEVLRLRSNGLTIGAVGAHLGLSPQTVKNHCVLAFRKLRAANIVEALESLGPTAGDERRAWLERAIAIEEASSAARIAVLRGELATLGASHGDDRRGGASPGGGAAVARPRPLRARAARRRRG